MSADTLEIDLSADKADNIKLVLENPEKLPSIIEVLSGDNRRQRQYVASIVAAVAAERPELLADHIREICDALHRPEAQTRWECLSALCALIPLDAKSCKAGLPGAVESLYEEDSRITRLEAMRFLCLFGATSKANSKAVWEHIDEGIQCYHGDYEFNDMLDAVVTFSEGAIDPAVKQALAERMKFDADNARGSLKRRARQIIENCG